MFHFLTTFSFSIIFSYHFYSTLCLYFSHSLTISLHFLILLFLSTSLLHFLISFCLSTFTSHFLILYSHPTFYFNFLLSLSSHCTLPLYCLGLLSLLTSPTCSLNFFYQLSLSTCSLYPHSIVPLTSNSTVPLTLLSPILSRSTLSLYFSLEFAALLSFSFLIPLSLLLFHSICSSFSLKF